MSESVDFIIERLKSHYAANGFARGVMYNDTALVRRLGCHPDDATLADLERILMETRHPATRHQYAKRLRSVFRTMRRLELTTSIVDEKLVLGKPPRSMPRPLSSAQVERLLAESTGRTRDWFVLGCYAGLRAMEVAGLRGDDLSWLDDGPVLRVRGKGGTDLTVPVSPLVADVVQRQGKAGRLWDVTPTWLSRVSCQEMRRVLGGKPNFHQCRHYFATTLLDVTEGDITAVKELMRHANIQTTLAYTRLDVRRQRRAVDLLGGGGATAAPPPERVARDP